VRYIAKWQATNWPLRNSRMVGSSVAQRACAIGQRVRKRQPDGGAIGDGGLLGAKRHGS
jgi:mannosyltransferase